MPQMQAYLTLAGENFDPDSVGKIVGFPADTIRHKTEILGNGCQFGHDEWSIGTELIESTEVSTVLQSLLSKYGGIVDKLKQASEISDADWSVLVLIMMHNDHRPSLFVPAAFINFLASLNASIGFDLYYL